MNSGNCYFLYTPLIHPVHTRADILQILSPERRERISRFRKQEDAIRSALAEVLLRYALITDFGIQNRDIEFERSRYGKPRLTGGQDIHFNISHSGNCVGCIVADKEVGLDIEMKRDNLPLAVAQEFFSLQEQRYIEGKGNALNPERFLQIWTLKESYVKAVGKGVYLPLDSFGFDMAEDDIQLYDSDGHLVNGKTFHSFSLDEVHYCAICLEGEKKTFQKVHLDENELIQRLNHTLPVRSFL